jgi:VIT1/CCC1 family predicted Fe2+/Mn2+ transporter
MIDLKRFCFGGPAAIVTSMALIVGLNAATAAKQAIVTSLLIIAVADNLTDSLSLHLFQESERKAEREAFVTTLVNFLTRLVISATFVVILLLLPTPLDVCASTLWGFVLLSALSHLLARSRQVGSATAIIKNCLIALGVIAASTVIGDWIPATLSSLLKS